MHICTCAAEPCRCDHLSVPVPVSRLRGLYILVRAIKETIAAFREREERLCAQVEALERKVAGTAEEIARAAENARRSALEALAHPQASAADLPVPKIFQHRLETAERALERAKKHNLSLQHRWAADKDARRHARAILVERQFIGAARETLHPETFAALLAQAEARVDVAVTKIAETSLHGSAQVEARGP